MKPRFSLILFSLLLVAVLAPQASGAERARSYVALKGGIYSPSSSFDITNINEAIFVGVESRYVWAEPSFGDQDIDLNGDIYALDGFDLDGFTTTLVLGYGF